MKTYIPVKHQENKVIAFPNISAKNHPVQHIGAMSVRLFNLSTTAKLPPVGKKYMCFQIDGKSA